MVKRVTVMVLCNICLSKGLEVEAGYSEDIQIGGLKRRLELCEHDAKGARAFRELVETYGETIREQMGAPAPGKRRVKVPQRPRQAPAAPDAGAETEQSAESAEQSAEASTSATPDEGSVGVCPDCGEGPFKNLGSHQKKHRQD